MQNGNKVRSIIHRHVRLVIECRHDVAVVRLVVLALNGKHGNTVVTYQTGCDIVLGRKGVRRAEYDVRATIAQCDHQVGGFRSDVQTGGDANSLERLILDEFLADDLQHVHRLVRPLDALLAKIGEFQTFYVTIHCGGCRRHNLLWRGGRE